MERPVEPIRAAEYTLTHRYRTAAISLAISSIGSPCSLGVPRRMSGGNEGLRDRVARSPGRTGLEALVCQSESFIYLGGLAFRSA
jgi:hypothetical protein